MACCETEFGTVSRAGDHPITHFEKWYSEMVSYAVVQGLMKPGQSFLRDDPRLPKLFSLDFLAAEAAYFMFAPHLLTTPVDCEGKLWIH